MEFKRQNKVEKLVNTKINDWTILEIIDSKYCLCKCSCGTIKNVLLNHIKAGNSKCCGCKRRKKSSLLCKKRNLKHNLSNSKLYGVWHSIKQRCYCKNNLSYKNYGARGIIMCDEWKNSFENFYNWAISNGYKIELEKNGRNKWTIDRIDNNGNYEPTNCRWVTILEQSNNKRNNRFIEHNGIKQTLAQWSNLLGISHTTISDRLNAGYSIDDALKNKNYRKEKHH